MALQINATRPNAGILRLPWSTPLEDWSDEFVVPLPRGISRHTVRIVRLADKVYAVKETEVHMAQREYRLLRDLQRLGLPAVIPQAVVSGRVADDGRPLPAVLVTEHLRFSLPYRSLFSHGVTTEHIPQLIDAMVILLVRLHLAGFYWGDVSLSNVLFRRDAGLFTAYLVDAESGELRPSLSARMRANDVLVGCENIFGELLDLEAMYGLEEDLGGHDIVAMIEQRYVALWCELTSEEEFDEDEMWRIEQRIEKLNDLGFDVAELDIVTDFNGDRIRIQPTVVELGHHQRELQGLTGLWVQDNQARRLLNDLASFTAAHGLGREDRTLVANRWLIEVYDRVTALVPTDSRGKLEPAEFFHEVLVHRWYLSERAGREVEIMDAARDYIDTILSARPEEAITADGPVGDEELEDTVS
jgi:tRNA A-37 threonylcarbamoyl transferase component Bud32